MDLTDILASLFGGGQSAPAFGNVAQVGDHANPNALQASLARFAAPQGQSAPPMPAPQPAQPQQPSMGAPAPQAQPDPQTTQASPAGGGIGDFLGSLFMPQTTAKNHTVAYLQQQGMDPGTANLIVQDPGMLRTYLQQKLAGKDQSDFDQRAAAAKQYGLDTSTPLGREYVLTGKLPNAIQGNDDTAKQVAGAIISGDQPPDMKGLYKYSAPIRAELAKQGYNLTTAQEDWQATQRFLASANGPQQLRLRQSVDFTGEQLDQVDKLASQWDAGRFKVLNAANLAAAKNGLYGQDAASLATKLDAAITDLTADLGNVYMGGNSPTDHALELAGKNLSANWSSATIHDMTKQIRQSLVYRQNSLRNAGVVGMPAGTNPYDQTQQASPQAAPQGNVPAATPQSAPQGAAPSTDTPPASYTGKNWKWLTPEQRKLWQ